MPRMKLLICFLFYLGTWYTLPTDGDSSSDSTTPIGQNLTFPISTDYNVDNACAEFNDDIPIGSGWLLSDCVTVWNSWGSTLEQKQLLLWPYRPALADVSTKLRQQGRPCVVESVNYPDGAGSSAIRHLATWIFAEEMGCDWILPGTHSRNVRADGDGSTLYCHKMMIRSWAHPFLDQEPGDNRYWRCEITNWLQFFHYDAHAANRTMSRSTKVLKMNVVKTPFYFDEAVEEFRQHEDGEDRLWEYLLLLIDKSSANRFFQLVASWDSFKRDITRNVVQRYRESFHESPRPWFNNEPTCMFSSSPKELDFAIHVRLGDRQVIDHGYELGYVGSIEAFMETITTAVTRRGLDTPMFHVFSETAMPCPRVGPKTFQEFPTWPVEAYQIGPCLAAKTPEDCPEKRAGAPTCNAERSGIFRVLGKPLYLHIGLDVPNELTCMAKADGILMGCSTFGQIAGVLNEGLKFFSFGCSGSKTPNHYKMMPPLAVAERGHLWVPVEGSWHNSSIFSDVIFEAALDEYLKNKQDHFAG